MGGRAGAASALTKQNSNVSCSTLKLQCVYVLTLVYQQVHISNTSQVADHCPVFALSDSTDAHYQQRCDHDHTDRCDRCQSLAENLTEIEEVLKETKFPSDVEKDEAVFLFQTAKLSILSWKCHILRSFNQDQARLDALEQLDEGDIVIVNDWAMKFLPQKYRESQTDWFGKRGISWHISVVYRRLDGVLQWQGFVHIIQTCKQESSSVVKIMQDVLRAIKLENNEISRAYFRQDNAGCYHSSSTILACPLISTSTGIKIQRIDFSDPQGGKGAADRLAATCKSHVRIFINEGNDVTTADQLKDALLSHGGVEGVRVVSMETIQDLPSEDDSRKIPAISKLNDFEFIADAITAWRAYGIGEGKEITVEKTSSGTYKEYMLVFCVFVYEWFCIISFILYATFLSLACNFGSPRIVHLVISLSNSQLHNMNNI